MEITVACDVDNPLLGPRGAAAVYAPQKGAEGVELALLEAGLTHWADVVRETTGREVRDAPGAGAAGGVGFAALALLGATMRPGIELLLDLLGFDEAVRGARLVVTGEGCLDEQTLHGKAPAGVAAAATRAGSRWPRWRAASTCPRAPGAGPASSPPTPSATWPNSPATA